MKEYNVWDKIENIWESFVILAKREVDTLTMDSDKYEYLIPNMNRWSDEWDFIWKSNL